MALKAINLLRRCSTPRGSKVYSFDKAIYSESLAITSSRPHGPHSSRKLMTRICLLGIDSPRLLLFLYRCLPRTGRKSSSHYRAGVIQYLKTFDIYIFIYIKFHVYHYHPKRYEYYIILSIFIFSAFSMDKRIRKKRAGD